MTTVTVQLELPVSRSFRVMQVAGMFDVPIEERLGHRLIAEVPGLDEEWRIGAIVGPSGSGKTTLAKAAFGEAVVESREWPEDVAIVECLGDQTPIKEIARVLTAVGLGSVPTWLKPYRLLSTGERFRADLARAILLCTGGNGTRRRGDAEVEGRFTPASAPPRETYLLVVDEFTSSLDRMIAKTVSGALGRLLRKSSGEAGRLKLPRLVAVTCHEDVLPWLQPDWVLRLDGAGGAELTRGGLRQPEIRLPVRQVPQAVWSQFARHHYLAGGLARSATCYAAFWDEGPIAFCAAVAALGWKKTKRITRLVTLPEFQGLGIAGRLLEMVAKHEAGKGNRVTITASHPAIVAHCSQSLHWSVTGHKPAGSTVQTYRGRRIGCSVGRAVVSFGFIAT